MSRNSEKGIQHTSIAYADVILNFLNLHRCHKLWDTIKSSAYCWINKEDQKIQRISRHHRKVCLLLLYSTQSWALSLNTLRASKNYFLSWIYSKSLLWLYKYKEKKNFSNIHKKCNQEIQSKICTPSPHLALKRENLTVERGKAAL